MKLPEWTPGLHAGRSGCSRQSGFSLIELMVAMVIGLLIMTAVLQLFLDITRTNNEMARTNAQIENGRFSIQMISGDLMHAGFWDGHVPEYDDLTAADAPAGYPASFVPPAPCEALAAWTAVYTDNLLRMPLQSFAEVPVGCESVVQNHKTGTDVLVVRYADTTALSAASASAGVPYFQASYCADDDNYEYVLGGSGFTLTKMDCVTPVDIRRFVAKIYFIRNDDTLMRAEFLGSAGWSVQPLIDGVEGFVVELGVDDRRGTSAVATVDYTAGVDWADPLNKVLPTNRGDGAPDTFVRCPGTGCSADELINVVAAKLHVLVRSIEPTPGYQDDKTYVLGTTSFTPTGAAQQFKRHVYSSSVRLTNVSARRETP